MNRKNSKQANRVSQNDPRSYADAQLVIIPSRPTVVTTFPVLLAQSVPLPSGILAIAGIPLYIYAVVFSSVSILTGIMWDISWHTTIGRDSFLTPPHVLVYTGAVVAGVFSGVQVLWYTFAASPEAKKSLVKIWGFFHSSLGALFCIWGAAAMLTSAPFDDWWHNAYGLDLVILSPPHTLLGTGMIMIQFGACITTGTYLNSMHHPQASPRQKRVLQVLFVIAAACFLEELGMWADEFISRHLQRTGFFYEICAAIYLVFLPAFGRGLRLKWGTTLIALTSFAIACGTNWTLQLVPATPKLGPILTHLTHLQSLSFPLLLFVPAVAIDKILWASKGAEWVKAIQISVAFVVLMLVVQYPFSGFLTESPGARNWFFGSDAWYYGFPPDYEYRYRFAPGQDSLIPELFPALLIAIGVGWVSACLGLQLGRWFQNLQR